MDVIVFCSTQHWINIYNEYTIKWENNPKNILYWDPFENKNEKKWTENPVPISLKMCRFLHLKWWRDLPVVRIIQHEISY